MLLADSPRREALVGRCTCRPLSTDCNHFQLYFFCSQSPVASHCSGQHPPWDGVASGTPWVGSLEPWTCPTCWGLQYSCSSNPGPIGRALAGEWEPWVHLLLHLLAMGPWATHSSNSGGLSASLTVFCELASQLCPQPHFLGQCSCSSTLLPMVPSISPFSSCPWGPPPTQNRVSWPSPRTVAPPHLAGQTKPLPPSAVCP